MNKRRFSILAAIPAALLFACAAGAGPAPQQAQPPETPLPGTQPRPSQSAMPDSSPANRTMHMDYAPNQGESFSRLAGRKGYITRKGAESDAWLERHFAKCDTSHDGKITQSEYDKCRTKYPPQH